MSVGLEQIRAAIGARIAAIPEIGLVHPYERYAIKDAQLLALMLWHPAPEAQPELRGWNIHRSAFRGYRQTSRVTRIETDWRIAGFMALQDARQTEILMDILVDQVRAAINSDLTLGGLVEAPAPDQTTPWGVQCPESGPYMYGGVLCHGVRLTLTTTHYVDASTDPAADPANAAPFKFFHANWDIRPIGDVGPDLPDDAHADATDHVILEQD